jgi:hypothetical protein
MNAYPGSERLEGRLLFAAGDLDLTFGGGDGVADVADAGRVHAMAFVGDDASVLVVGSTPIPLFGTGGQGLKLRLVRYRPDGTLDTTFGAGGDDGDGLVTLNDVTANGNSTLLAIDSAGRILVAVEGTILLRFSADGILDTGFGEAGKAWAYFGHPSTPTALRVYPDGKIGVSVNVSAPFGEMWGGSARFNPDGSPDLSYGFGGTVVNSVVSQNQVALSAVVGYDTLVPDEFANGVKSARVQSPPVASVSDGAGRVFALDFAITDDGRTHLALVGLIFAHGLDPTFAHAVHSTYTSGPNLIAVQPGTGRILFTDGRENFGIMAAQSGPPLDAPRPVPGLDATPPTAEMVAVPDVTAASTSPFTFVVRYADDVALRDLDFDSSDVRVTAPDGSSLLAQFAGIAADPAALSARVATYVYTPPGGGFTAAMDGAYTVSIEPNQVTDTAANAVAAAPVGTFSVNIPADAPNLSVSLVTSRLGRAGAVVAAGRPRGGVSFTVENTGTRRIAGAVAFSVVASVDPVLDGGDVEIAAATRRLVLAPNRRRRITIRPQTVPAGLPEGDYHLLARVDADRAVAETSEIDNVSLSPTPVLHVSAAAPATPKRKRDALFGDVSVPDR